MRAWSRRLADYNTHFGFWLPGLAHGVARVSKYGTLCIDTSADEYRRGLNIVLTVLNINGRARRLCERKKGVRKKVRGGR